MFQAFKIVSLQHTGGGPLLHPCPLTLLPTHVPGRHHLAVGFSSSHLAALIPRSLRGHDEFPTGRMALWRCKLQWSCFGAIGLAGIC